MADTFIKSLLSKELPGLEELPLADQAKIAAAYLGVPDIGLAARAIGVEFEEPGFTSGLVSGLSTFPAGVGEFIRAVAGPGPVSDELIKFAQDAQFRRPQLSLFDDGLSAIPGIIGQVAGITLPAIATRGLSLLAQAPRVANAAGVLGTAARAAAPAVRALDTTAGRSALFGLPTFGQAAGSIREEQGRELTPGETLQALAGSLAVGRLEQLGGVERAFEKGITSLVPAVAGEGLVRRIGRAALQSGGTEAVEELIQSPFEQVAASKPLDEMNPVDVLEQVASGFIGGAALGTAAAPFAIRKQNAQLGDRTDTPSATSGEPQQLNLPLPPVPPSSPSSLTQTSPVPSVTLSGEQAATVAPTPAPTAPQFGTVSVADDQITQALNTGALDIGAALQAAVGQVAPQPSLPFGAGQQGGPPPGGPPGGGGGGGVPFTTPFPGPPQQVFPLNVGLNTILQGFQGQQPGQQPQSPEGQSTATPTQSAKPKGKAKKAKVQPPQTPGTTFNVRKLKNFEKANDDFAIIADQFVSSGGHRNSLRHLVKAAEIDVENDTAETLREKALTALRENKIRNPDTRTRIQDIFSITDEEILQTPTEEKAPAPVVVKGFEGASEGFNKFAQKFIELGGRAPSLKTIVKNAKINPKKDSFDTIKKKIAKALDKGAFKNKNTVGRLRGVVAQQAPETETTTSFIDEEVKKELQSAAAELDKLSQQQEQGKGKTGTPTKTPAKPRATGGGKGKRKNQSAAKNAKAEQQAQPAQEAEAEQAKGKTEQPAEKIEAEQPAQEAKAQQPAQQEQTAQKAKAQQPAQEVNAEQATTKTEQVKGKTEQTTTKTEQVKGKTEQPTQQPAQQKETAQKGKTEQKKQTAKKEEYNTIGGIVKALIFGDLPFEHVTPKDPSDPTNAELQAEVEARLGRKVPTNSIKVHASYARGFKAAELLRNIITEQTGKNRKRVVSVIAKELVDAYNKNRGKKEKPVGEDVQKTIEYALLEDVSDMTTGELRERLGDKGSIEATQILRRTINIIKNHAKESEALVQLKNEYDAQKRKNEGVIEGGDLTPDAVPGFQTEVDEKQLPENQEIQQKGRNSANVSTNETKVDTRDIAKDVLNNFGELEDLESGEARNKKIDALVSEAEKEWKSRAELIAEAFEAYFKDNNRAIHDNKLKRRIKEVQDLHSLLKTSREWWLIELKTEVEGETEEARAKRLNKTAKHIAEFEADPNNEGESLRIIGPDHVLPFVVNNTADRQRAKKVVRGIFYKRFKVNRGAKLYIVADHNDAGLPQSLRKRVQLSLQKRNRVAFASSKGEVVIIAPALVELAAKNGTSIDIALEAVLAHEVGVHVKLRRLGTSTVRELAAMIRRWANDKKHPANELARMALRDSLHHSGEENYIANEEFVAYFVTRAILSGNHGIINNTGVRGLLRRIARFFRQVLRKLGIIPKDNLTTADLVDFVTGLMGRPMGNGDTIILSNYDRNSGFSSATQKLIQKPKAALRLKEGVKLSDINMDAFHTIVQMRMQARPGATVEEMFDYLSRNQNILPDNVTLEDVKETLDKLETVVYSNGRVYPVHTLKNGVNKFVNAPYNLMPKNLKNLLHRIPGFDNFLKVYTKDLEAQPDLEDVLITFGEEALRKVGIEAIQLDKSSTLILGADSMILHPPNDVEGYMDSYADMVLLHGHDAATPHLPPGGMENATKRFVEAYIPEQFRDRAFSAAMTLQDVVHKFDLAMDFSHNLVRRFSKVLPSLRDFMDFAERAAARQRHYELRVSQIAEQMLALPEEHQKRVRQLLFDMTWNEQWGFQPEWRNEKVEINPEYQQRYEALTDAEKSVIQQMLKLGDETLEFKRQLMMDETEDLHEMRLELIEENLTGEEKEAALKEEEERYRQHKKIVRTRMPGKLKGPYVPLRRRGAYAVVAMSKELLAARRGLAAAKGDLQTSAAMRSVKELEVDPQHYLVIFKPTMGQAKLAAEELKKSGDYAVVDTFERHKYYQSIDHLPDSMFTMFEELLSSNRELREAAEKVRVDLRGLIHDAYISTYQDIAAHQSALVRRKVHGITADDIFEGFIEQGRSDAHFLAQLEYGRFVWRALREMRKEAAVPGKIKGFEREERMRVFNEMAKRLAIFTMSDDSAAVNTILSFGSFMQLLTSPAFYAQNLTQPWMMSLPYIAGRFDYAKAANYLLDAYKRVANDPALKVTQWPVNIDKFQSKVGKEAEAIKELLDRGRIDIGIDVELGQMLDQSPLRSTLGRAVFHLSRIARRVEVINRLTTALAAYRLEYEAAMARGMSEDAAHKLAMEYANEVILQTHGDYAKFNSPVLFHRNGLLRVLTQFRKFQLIQARLIWNMLNDAVKKADPIERAAARRALLFTMGTTAMMTGIRGLPLWAPLSLLYAIANGDDPEDFETWLRRHAGADSPLVDLLFTGLPKLVGLDLTNKIGMGQVFNPIPFIDFDITTRDGYARTLIALGGPIVGGLGPRFANGINLMYMGNYWRGLEELMPRGLRDAMRAYRYASEGMTTQRGFQLMDAEEINLYDALTQAVGLPSTKISRAQARRAAMFEVDDYFKRRSSILRSRYFRAVKRGDNEERRQVITEWREMNERRKELGLKPRPLSGLTSVVREGRRIERRVVGGIQFTDATREYAEALAEFY